MVLTQLLEAKPKIEFNYEYLYESSDLGRVKEWISSNKYFTVDAETTGLNPFQDELVLVQIGNPEKQWILDARTIGIDELAPIFADKDMVKLGHGLQFDAKFFLRRGWTLKKLACTVLAEKVLRCGLSVSAKMETLAEYYLHLKIPKETELRTSFGTTPVNGFSEQQLQYAAGDVIYPVYFARHQKPLIKERGLKNTLTLENAVLPVIAKMELEGMRIDKEAWVALYQEAVARRAEQEKILNKLFKVQLMHQEGLFDEGELVNIINYGSHQQVKSALKKLGYNFKTTNAETLALAAIEESLPRDIAAALIAHRIFSTRASRYGLNFFNAIEEVTGHVHADFTQNETTTGRLSSGDKEEAKHKRNRVNFQNIPRDIRYRNCFIPDEGDVFIVYDLQAIEPRILGDMSLDPTYIKTFQTGGDIYANIGRNIYKEEVSKAPGKPKELRDKTKIGVLGTSYGTGKKKFHRKMLLDLNRSPEGFLNEKLVYIEKDESDALWEGIFETCPGIRDSLDRSSSLADPLRSNRIVHDDRAAQESFGKVFHSIKTVLESFPYAPEDIDTVAREHAQRRALVTYSESLNGRKRFFKKYHRSWWTDGRNHPIQSSAADILKVAMVYIDNVIEKKGYDAAIINQVHDELVIRCKKEQAEELAPLVKNAMEAAGNKFFRVVSCKATGGICTKWEKD
jgi:DNA polymerase I-like protein with 3'-5' exonuclease and polymerase domains